MKIRPDVLLRFVNQFRRTSQHKRVNSKTDCVQTCVYNNSISMDNRLAGALHYSSYPYEANHSTKRIC